MVSRKNQIHDTRLRIVLAALFTLLAVSVMVGLGVWQLQRAGEKHERQEQISSRSQEAPLTLSQALSSTADMRDFPVRVAGTINTERVFLLDNRVRQGVVGYHVVAPVKTDSAQVLVNFGFVAGSGVRARLPEIVLPTDEREFMGSIAIPEDNPLIQETATTASQWPKVIQQLDLAVMETLAASNFAPFVLQLDPEQPEGFIREWQPVVMPPEKHVAYAIQWFALAIAGVIIFIFAVKKRNISRP